MRRTRKLFANVLTCVACQCQAIPGAKREPGKPLMLSIGTNIYRRAQGKGMVKAGRGVSICEPCFIRAEAGIGAIAPSDPAIALLAGLRASLSACYSAIVAEQE
jgi:hypothetical protein